MGRYATPNKPPILMPDPKQNSDSQFERPIISVDLDTGTVVKSNYFKEELPMEPERKPTTAELNREKLPKARLEELLKTKSRKEICEEYELKSFELANVINYYKRNGGMVVPDPVRKQKVKAEPVEPEPEAEIEKEVMQCAHVYSSLNRENIDYSVENGEIVFASDKEKEKGIYAIAGIEYPVNIEQEAETIIPEEEPKHKCRCAKDNAILEELASLREELNVLKKHATALQAFSFKHRHQIGPGHYSEWGVAD